MRDVLTDRVRGVLYGQAIGDALGFATEFLSKPDATRMFPDGVRSYADVGRRFQPCEQWRPGDWTDDTDQLLCILDSLLDCNQVDAFDIAARLRHWGLTDGYGMGRTVYFAVNHPRFATNPYEVAAEYWEGSGRQAAANGAVMRTSVLGVWEYRNREKVIANAEAVCRLTHVDPRCVGSCVAVCLAIRGLLLEHDFDALVHHAAASVRGYHPEMQAAFEVAEAPSIQLLDLDEGMTPGEVNRFGYTLKALSAAFWALRHASSFEDGLSAIIAEAGDADTNAAVAGALLGARFGFSGIPSAWIEGLVYREALEELVEKLNTKVAESSE